MIKKLIFSALIISFTTQQTSAMLTRSNASYADIIHANPLTSLFATGGVAATAYYIYNPEHARNIVSRIINTSAVLNSIVVGGAIGTGAGLFSSFMADRQMRYSTLLPFIVGMALYTTTTDNLIKAKIPYHENISYLAALSTWYKPNWLAK